MLSSDASDEANKYLNKIPDTLKSYYNPYVNTGTQALGTLNTQYNNLVSNPSQMLSKLGQNFQQSPGYQWQLNQGTQAANQAASAGGMAGTPQAQQNSASIATNLSNQDFYNYLSQQLGLYQTGLNGLSGLNEMGFKASGTLAEDLASLLGTQGNMAWKEALQNQEANSFLGGTAGDMVSSLLLGF